MRASSNVRFLDLSLALNALVHTMNQVDTMISQLAMGIFTGKTLASSNCGSETLL
jgi:hypothetical protein